MPAANDPVLAMQIYNLSDKDVTSIQVCALCYGFDGEQYARHVERIQDLDAPSRHAFEAAILLEEGVKAQDLEVLIEKVWFEDKTVWRRGAVPATEFTPSPLLKDEQLP